MNKLMLLFSVMILLLPTVSAAKTCAEVQHPNCIEIDSCGFYDYNDAYLLLTQDISDPMSCIFLKGEIVLDLNGYTVNFADAAYENVSNNDFEEWTYDSGLGKDVPVGWDVSQATSIERRTKNYKPLINEYSAFIRNSGETIVSSWINLPTANRHYRAGIIFQAESSGNGPRIEVERQNGDIVCSRVNDDDFDGGANVAFCDFDGEPAGNYRLRVTTSTSNTYLDLGGIFPSHDTGIASIRWYTDSGCNSGSGYSNCISPDYMSQSSSIYPDITIKDGTVRTGAFGYLTFGLRASDLLGGNVDVDNVTVINSGFDSKAITITEDGTISNSEFYIYQPWITTRHTTYLTGNNIGSNTFRDNIAIGGQGVLSISGSAKVYNNYIRNDQATTNHYAIMMSGGGDQYAEIYNNIFDPVKGSGIILYVSGRNKVYNNTFYLKSEVCNPEYNEGGDTTYSTNGIRMNDYGAGTTRYNEVYDNTFYINGNYEFNPIHPDCQPRVTGIFYSNNGVGNKVHNNKFYITKTNDLEEVYTFGLYIGGDAANPVNNKLFYDNYFETNDKAAWISCSYGESENIWLENNTFVKVPNIYYTPELEDAALRIGHYSYARNIRLINNKYLNGFDADSYYFTGVSENYDLTKKHYLHVFVEDGNANRLSNILVTARSQSGGPDIAGTTDSNGYALLHLTEYDESGTTDPDGNHNRDYQNPYEVVAEYNSVEYSYGIVNANSEETITLMADTACSNGATRSCGTDVGECTQGTQTCNNEVWGPCNGEITSVQEICDGLDNDCDGTDDNGLGTTTCGQGLCTNTVNNCVGGVQQVCDPFLGQIIENEVNYCTNGIDDDCEGDGDISCENTIQESESGTQFTCTINDPLGTQWVLLIDDSDGSVELGLSSDEWEYYFLEAETFEYNPSHWNICPGAGCENDISTSTNYASGLSHAVSNENNGGLSPMTKTVDFVNSGTYHVWARSYQGDFLRSWQVGTDGNLFSELVGDEGSGSFDWEYLGSRTLSGNTLISINDAAIDGYWAYPDILLFTTNENFDPRTDCGVDASNLQTDFPYQYGIATCGVSSQTVMGNFNKNMFPDLTDWSCAYINSEREIISTGTVIIPSGSPYDLDNSGTVDIEDLLILVNDYGGPSSHDFNDDGVLNIIDVLTLINNWG